jgi:hypothetical protein
VVDDEKVLGLKKGFKIKVLQVKKKIELLNKVSKLLLEFLNFVHTICYRTQIRYQTNQYHQK